MGCGLWFWWCIRGKRLFSFILQTILAVIPFLPSEDFKKNESPYARRYIKKYHDYNVQKVAEEKAAKELAEKEAAQ